MKKTIIKTLLALSLLCSIVACGSNKGPFTINFEENGGAELTNLVGDKGDEIPSLPTAVKEGYTFGGWFTNKTCTKSFDETTYSKNITLYAKWTAKTLNVNLHFQEGKDSQGNTDIANYCTITTGDTSVTLPTVISNVEGKYASRYFNGIGLGFYPICSGDGSFLEFSVTSYRYSSEIGFVVRADNVTLNLYAEYKNYKATITLDYNGGTFNSATSKDVTVASGDSPTFPIPSSSFGDFAGYATTNNATTANIAKGTGQLAYEYTDVANAFKIINDSGTYKINILKANVSITFYAVYVVKTVTATFYDGDTKLSYTTTLSSGMTSLAGHLPTYTPASIPDYQIFLGWKDSGYKGSSQNLGKICDTEGTLKGWDATYTDFGISNGRLVILANDGATVKIYAYIWWKSYNIKLIANDGTDHSNEVNIVPGSNSLETLQVTRYFTRTGYFFRGYSTTAEYVETNLIFDNNGYVCRNFTSDVVTYTYNSVTTQYENNVLIDGGTLTFYSIWNPNSFMGLFQNGSTSLGNHMIKTGDTTLANAIPTTAPTSTGKTFIGYSEVNEDASTLICHADGSLVTSYSGTAVSVSNGEILVLIAGTCILYACFE